MTKMIHVWGCNGSGKTTLAVNLAYALAQNSIVALISSNLQYGELQIYFNQHLSKEKGMIAALSHGAANVKDCFMQSCKNENLFYLAMPNETDTLLLANTTQAEAERLLHTVGIYFDYIVVDGDENINNAVSTVSLMLSDHIFITYRPDTTNLNWHIATQNLIGQMRIGYKIKTVLQNDCRFPIPVFCKMSSLNPTYTLPYIEDTAIWANMGELVLEKSTKEVKQYRQTISSIISVI